MTRNKQQIIISGIVLFLGISIFACYGKVPGYGFIDLDDPFFITNNYNIQKGFTLETIDWALTTGLRCNWMPVTWLSFMLDYSIGGLDPFVFHLDNLILHFLNSILLFLILFKMTGSIWKSAAVSFLFALHPINIESVAWITERKNTLSTFFWFLSIGAYVYYAENFKRIWYLLSLFFFILGLASKSMLVTLPFVLLLLDFWPLGRINPGDGKLFKSLADLAMEKIPFFIFTFLSCVATYWVQKTCGAVSGLDVISLPARLSNVITAYATYLRKALLPYDLAIIYPFSHEIPLYLSLLSLMLLLVITGAALYYAKTKKYLITGWLLYLGTLVPVIGLVQVGHQSMADRYAYIPMTGIFIMVVFGVADIIKKKAVLAVVFTLAMALYSSATLYYVGIWKSSTSIFTQAAKVNENNPVAYINLGYGMAAKGDWEKALEYYEKALFYSPKSDIITLNIGVAHSATGDMDKAGEYYKKAIELNPKNATALNNMGNYLLAKSELKKAAHHYVRAIQAEPEYIDPHINYGVTLLRMGKPGSAAVIYSNGLKIAPGDPRLSGAYRFAVHSYKSIEDEVEKFKNLLLFKADDKGILKTLQALTASKKRLTAIQNRYCKELSTQQGFDLKTSTPEKIKEVLKIYAEKINIFIDLESTGLYKGHAGFHVSCIMAGKAGEGSSYKKAFKYLENAINNGFSDFDLIMEDNDLTKIRQHPEYSRFFEKLPVLEGKK